MGAIKKVWLHDDGDLTMCDMSGEPGWSDAYDIVPHVASQKIEELMDLAGWLANHAHAHDNRMPCESRVLRYLELECMVKDLFGVGRGGVK